MTAYYNEIEPYCTAWLQNLMDAGEIAPGTIDDRSILDVSSKDLAGHDRCHFFAGIAGWDYALRLAGWPNEWLVWTGSCPCQPFSSAGRGSGGADERHLWPAWFWLIRQCRPAIIFGEQVASKAGLAWLDVVFSDLEAAGYACGAVDLCAAGLGAPHIRQRLWFVAYLPNTGFIRKAQPQDDGEDCLSRRGFDSANCGESISGISRIQEKDKSSHQEGRQNEVGNGQRILEEDGGVRKEASSRPNPTGELADCQQPGLEGCNRPGFMELQGTEKQIRSTWERGVAANPWHPLHWLPCRDGKYRPTGVVAHSDSRTFRRGSVSRGKLQKRKGSRESYVTIGNNYKESGSTQPFIQPLAHGVPQRVGRLRAYGNAIVAQVAATFIKAVMEILGD